MKLKDIIPIMGYIRALDAALPYEPRHLSSFLVFIWLALEDEAVFAVIALGLELRGRSRRHLVLPVPPPIVVAACTSLESIEGSYYNSALPRATVASP